MKHLWYVPYVALLLAAFVFASPETCCAACGYEPRMAAQGGPNYEAAAAMMRAGKTLASAGKHEEATAKFEGILAAYPEEREICALTLCEQGRMWATEAEKQDGSLRAKVECYDQALRAFQQVIWVYPEQLAETAFSKLAMANDCYFPLGEYEEGLVALVEMVTQAGVYEGCGVPEYGARFQPWVEAEVQKYLERVAGKYTEEGRPGEIAHLVRSILGETCPSPVLELVIKPMLGSGCGLGAPRTPEEEARHAQLVSLYESWLEGTPLANAERRHRLLYDLACIQVAYGETELAEGECREVLEQGPGTEERAVAAGLLGRILRSKKDVKGALEAYVAALRTLSPGSDMGEVVEQMLGGPGEEKQCQRGVEELSALVETYSASGLAGAPGSGDSYMGLRRLGESMTRWEVDGGGMHMRKDQEAVWRRLFQASLEMPTSLEYRRRVELAIVDTYMCEKNYEGAVALCGEIMERYPDSEEAVYAQLSIGQARQWQGIDACSAAREAYQKFIDEHPGTYLADMAQEGMDKLAD